MPFLYATSHLILFYISAKYHKNILKGLWLTERTRNQWIISVKYNKERNAKSKKSRVVTLVRDTLSGLYYLSTKYHRKIPKCTKECCRPRRGLNPRPPGLQSDGASNWATKAGYSKSKKARVVIFLCDTSTRPDLHFYQVKKVFKLQSGQEVLRRRRHWRQRYPSPKQYVPPPCL